MKGNTLDRYVVGSLLGCILSLGGCAGSAEVEIAHAEPEPAVGAEAPPEPEEEKVVTVGEDRLELTETILFAHDSDQIEEGSKQVLQAIATTLKDAPEIRRVLIHGHTDQTGSPRYNRELSSRRADAVERYLREHGVPQELESQGFGSSQPLCTDSSRQCQEKNRRVEFLIGESS